MKSQIVQYDHINPYQLIIMLNTWFGIIDLILQQIKASAFMRGIKEKEFIRLPFINNKKIMKAQSNYKIDFIEYQWEGVLGMAMAPGKNYTWAMERRDLAKDIEKIKNQYKIDMIVCLIEPEEMEWLGIPDQLKELEKAGIPYVHFPIEDMDVPSDVPKFKNMVQHIVDEYLKKGKRVMVHCQSGNGRSGMFVAACYLYKGMTPEEAIRKTRQTRRYAIETNRQVNFVNTLKFEQ